MTDEEYPKEAIDMAGQRLCDSIDADIIDAVIKAGKILDEQDVPKTNRKIWPEE